MPPWRPPAAGSPHVAAALVNAALVARTPLRPAQARQPPLRHATAPACLPGRRGLPPKIRVGGVDLQTRHPGVASPAPPFRPATPPPAWAGAWGCPDVP